MKDFLDSVDSAAQKGERERNLGDQHVTFIPAVILALKANEVFAPGDLVGLSASTLTAIPSGGKAAFINRAIVKANAEATLATLPCQGESSEAMQAFTKALRKEDPTVHVDIGLKLREVCLKDVPHSCLPQGAVVDSLATEVSKLRKKGVPNPFVFVEIRKFVPYWCAELLDLNDSDDEGQTSKEIKDLARALGAQSKAPRPLNLLQWQAGFDRYAIAAVATGQLSLCATMAHKDICMQVAARAKGKVDARGEARRHWLAIVYDELARRDWSERAYHGEEYFVVDRAAMQLDPAILLKAEAVYDQMAGQSKGKPAHHGGNYQHGGQSYYKKDNYQNKWSGSSWNKRQGGDGWAQPQAKKQR